MKAKVLQSAVRASPLFKSIRDLAASLNIGTTSLLTSSRLVRIPFAEALITSSGCGIPTL